MRWSCFVGINDTSGGVYKVSFFTMFGHVTQKYFLFDRDVVVKICVSFIYGVTTGPENVI